MIPARLALLLPALGLAACAACPSGEAVGRYPAASAAAEPGAALASLPAAAGRVVAVRRTAFANGVRQEIVLEGPRAMAGENRITVEALTTARTGLRGGGGEELRIGPPSDTEIAAATDREVPGMAMRIAETPVRGEAGPVGYAYGAAGRLTCVYAWQYLAPARPLSLFEGVTDTGALPLSVRVRLCREQPLAALVDDLRGLRVPAAGEAAAPTGRGDPLDAALGTGGGAAAPLPAADAEAAPPRPARLHRRAAAPRHAWHRRAPVFRRRAVAAARRAPPRDEGPAALSAPRLPLPAEVAAEAAPRRAPVAAAAAVPAPAPVADAMPMPR